MEMRDSCRGTTGHKAQLLVDFSQHRENNLWLLRISVTLFILWLWKSLVRISLCNVTSPCRAIAGALECRLFSFFPCLFSRGIFKEIKPAALQPSRLLARRVLGEGLFMFVVFFFFFPSPQTWGCSQGHLLVVLKTGNEELCYWQEGI